MTDAAARARALDPTESFIVQAPAGSGKTELLNQRYLRLLATVGTPEQIVAITFTKKAAAEMRSRVLAALQAAAGPRPDQPHKALTWDLARAALDRDRALGWNLLDNPGRIRMQTIDALAMSIARQMPVVAGMGALPQVVENATPLYREAAERTIEGDTAADAIVRLLLHLDNNFSRTADLIATMLGRRDQWLRHIGTGEAILDNAREHMERCLYRLTCDQIQRLHSAAEGMPDAPGPSIDDAEAWRNLAAELLTKDGEWRKAQAYRTSCVADRDRLLTEFNGLRRLPPTQLDDAQWEALRAVVQILPAAAAQLGGVFAERQRVDFVAISLAAVRALGTREHPTDLALAFGERVHHLLVDEYQDTSYTQLELLELLTAGWEPGDGRTLFVVGDPMQSIYRFRQAEVSLFLRARNNGIGNLRLRRLTLTRNFRSAPELVNWFNSAFPTVFPAEADPVMGGVPFSPSEAAQTGESTIAVHAFPSDARDQEARRVAELVAHHLQTEVGRPVLLAAHAEVTAEASNSSSIAVLVRARSHLPEILAALREAGIRYQAVEIDALGARPVVEDLLSLTFALLHPADRISWLAVLRAPWCGLTLPDLYAIAGGDRYAPVWDLMRRADLRLSDEGARRLARVTPILESALAQTGRLPLRIWVEETWTRLGGPACASGADLADAKAYLDLLDNEQRGGDIENFQTFRARVTELFAQPDAAAGDRVQVMTIHKAKGLEFDTVILAGMGAQGRLDESRLLHWHEPSETEVLFAPVRETRGADGPLNAYLQSVENEKLAYETQRLLYVAATRARRVLHLTGCAGVNKDGTVKLGHGSLFRILKDVVGAECLRQVAAQPAAPAPVKTNMAVQNVLRRVPAAWSAPPPPAPVAWTRDERAAGDDEFPMQWGDADLRSAGTVVHAFLQRIAREGIAAWTEEKIYAHRGGYESLLRGLGVPPREIASNVDRVCAALSRTLADERGRWILTSHTDAVCEYALSGVTGGVWVSGRIDRTFIDGDGVRWIIDYKTGAREGKDAAKFLEEERERHAAQMERYARLFAQLESRPVRLGLYFPLMGPSWLELEAPAIQRTQASLLL